VNLRPDDYPPEDDGNRRSGLIWAAVVVALLLVIGAAAYAIVFLGKGDKTKTYQVPNVVGQAEDAATKALSTHFRPVKGADTSGPCFGGTTVKEGYVCTLEPDPTQSLKDGSTVTYHLYKTPTEQVPYVEGKSYGEAIALLNQHNLKATRHNINNRASAGTVLHQSIDAYQQVAPGTTVTLDVSTGMLRLPDVTGKTFDDAQSRLNSVGFTDVAQDPATVETHDQSKDGEVADMSPSPGNTYDPSQKVTLKLYKYVPLPTTSCAPSGTTGPSGAPSSGGAPPSGPATGGASSSPC
jgi:serine/threonine-protein kinase